MGQTVSISFRVDRRKAARLDRLAQATDRSRTWLLEQALDSYLDVHAWQVEQIRKGMAAADRGEVVGHDRVAAWLRSWGTARERKPPR